MIKSFKIKFLIKKREQEQKQHVRKMQEQDDNMTEIANAIFSNLLCENPDQAVSAFGSHRVVSDRWKGMSEEQLKRIREEQLKQIEDKKVTSLLTLYDRLFKPKFKQK